MTNLFKPPSAPYHRELQELWMVRILLNGSMWKQLRQQTVYDLSEYQDLPIVAWIESKFNSIRQEFEMTDEESSLDISQSPLFEQLDLIAEAPDSVIEQLENRRFVLEDLCKDKIYTSAIIENNMLSMQKAFGLTDLETRCLYWTWYLYDDSSLLNCLIQNTFNLKDGGLPLYVRFCSAAFDLPEEEVAAAFSPEGTLRKREIITLDPENSDLRYPQYWFQPYNPSEVQGLFKLVPMTEQDWIHRWLTPTKNTVGALPEFDTIPGIASLVTPMLAKALEDNIQGVHVVLRVMDDGASRIVASHIARALDVPLYQLYQDNWCCKIGEARRRVNMFSGRKFIVLYNEPDCDVESFEKIGSKFARPCIWPLTADNYCRVLPVFPVIKLTAHEFDIRLMVIKKVADKLLTDGQRSLLARQQMLPIDTILLMINDLKNMKADEETVSAAVTMLTSNRLATR